MGLALARLEAAVGLVDDVGPAAATDDTAIAVTRLQGLERVANLHGRDACLFSYVSMLEKRSGHLGKRGREVKRGQPSRLDMRLPASKLRIGDIGEGETGG